MDLLFLQGAFGGPLFEAAAEVAGDGGEKVDFVPFPVPFLAAGVEADEPDPALADEDRNGEEGEDSLRFKDVGFLTWEGADGAADRFASIKGFRPAGEDVLDVEVLENGVGQFGRNARGAPLMTLADDIAPCGG